MPHDDRQRDGGPVSHDRHNEHRDPDAFFDRDRGERFERERGGSGIGGWGSLLEDEHSGGTSTRNRLNERERGFGPDDDRSDIPRDETERLIASNKVEGTPVFDRHGERLGAIHNFMVDKFRGQVVYAVLRHSSGFLGLDDRFYPLDWDQLTFDARLGGYHIAITQDELKNLGSWDRNQRWQGGGAMERGSSGRDRDFERRRLDRERDRTRDRR